MQIGKKVQVPTIKKPQQGSPNILQGTSKSSRGRMFWLIGAQGIGKTTFAAQFPGTYWIIDPKEVGIIDLVESGSVNVDMSMIHSPVMSWTDLIAFNDSVLSERLTLPQEVQTLVYESTSGFEQECHKHCCQLNYNNDWSSRKKGFMFYREGYSTAAKEFWVTAVNQWCQLREIGYNIILTGHSKMKTKANVDSVDWIYEGCNCQDPTWEVTSPYFENIFFLTFDVESSKESDFAKGKASSATRMLRVTKTPWHDAKNRIRLMQDIQAEEGPAKLYADLCKLAGLNPQTLKFV